MNVTILERRPAVYANRIMPDTYALMQAGLGLLSFASHRQKQRVQSVMDGRMAKKHRRMKRDFAFSGLIACHT